MISKKRFIFPILFITGLLCLSFLLFSQWLPEFYWFESFQAQHLWIQIFSYKAKTFLVFFALAYFILRSQVAIARHLSKKAKADPFPYLLSKPLELIAELFKAYQHMLDEYHIIKWSKRIIYVFTEMILIIISLMLASISKQWWLDIQLLQKAPLFNKLDPIFSLDLSFYVFQLPILEKIRAWVLLCVFLALLASVWVYFTNNILLKLFSSKRSLTPKFHLACIGSVLIVLFSLGLYFSQFQLLLSSRGSVLGAGFTDVYATLISFRIQIVLLLLLASTLLYFGLKKKPLFLYALLVLCVANPLLIGGVYAGFLQRYIVSPNELEKEIPFIKHNIELTRFGYGLNNVVEKPFEITTKQNLKELYNTKNTMRNIRLWNEDTLKQTFKQLQEIRLYYEFKHVDVGVYNINGNKQQVMLSARELDINQLSSKAKTWVNEHLIYTHGFGLCLSPVNQVSPEGLPYFFIKDLPPTKTDDLAITQPEIYFGEATDNYVITNTKQAEFNYPKGDQNEQTHYHGKGGIKLSSLFKRFIFSWHLSDSKLLFSSYITRNSKLMFERNIETIARKITPFLTLDSDPYLVITKEGKLVWLIDAYTKSNRLPYSESFNKHVNYIRNSVIISIDAYDGHINYYVKDTKDPIIQALEKIFPGFFKPLDKLSADLFEHLRYPRDLFHVQSKMFRTYHMKNPQLFYNREDLWEIPKETYGESKQEMTPYYIVSQYPDETEDSFSLVLPFTPAKKNNMLAFFRAHFDPKTKLNLTIYTFPKERTIFGPLQIESRIDQDTEISQKLTLWGQKGSRVIRGNLMVLPFQNNLLYIEPIYLQATQSELPEFKRIILAYQDKVIMSDSIEHAMQRILDGFDKTYTATKTKKTTPLLMSNKNLRVLFKDLKTAFKTLNWDQVGVSLSEIEQAIEKLDQSSNHSL